MIYPAFELQYCTLYPTFQCICHVWLYTVACLWWRWGCQRLLYTARPRWSRISCYLGPAQCTNITCLYKKFVELAGLCTVPKIILSSVYKNRTYHGCNGICLIFVNIHNYMFHKPDMYVQYSIYTAPNSNRTMFPSL